MWITSTYVRILRDEKPNEVKKYREIEKNAHKAEDLTTSC